MKRVGKPSKVAPEVLLELISERISRIFVNNELVKSSNDVFVEISNSVNGLASPKAVYLFVKKNKLARQKFQEWGLLKECEYFGKQPCISPSSGEECKQLWIKIRSNYRKALIWRKKKNCRSSGNYKSIRFEKQLEYLRPYIQSRRPSSPNDYSPQICEDSHQDESSQMTDPGEQQHSPAPESIVTPPLHTNKKRKVEVVMDKSMELVSLAYKYLSRCEGTNEIQDKYSDIANVWAQKMRELSPKQSLFAEKAINDILFEASVGSLNKYSVKINESDKDLKIDTSTSRVRKYTRHVTSSFK